MQDELKSKIIKLYAKHMDVPPVYNELKGTYPGVKYPDIVELINETPLASAPPKYSIKDLHPIDAPEEPTTPRREYRKRTLERRIELPAPEKKERKRFSSDKRVITELHQVLLRILSEKAQGWAEKNAVVFDNSTGRIHEFDKIIDVLTAYEQYSRGGYHFDSVDVGIKARTSSYFSAAILRRLKLTRNIPPPTPELKRALIYALGIPVLSATDAAHFLHLPKDTLRHYIKTLKLPGFSSRKREGLTAASQVYEAQDAGFTLDEIASYTHLTIRKAEDAISKRKTLEPLIVNILRKIYPDKNITLPYHNH